MTSRATFAAHSLAMELARRGHLARSIEANVTAAGFRITAEQVQEAMGIVDHDNLPKVQAKLGPIGRRTQYPVRRNWDGV